MLWPMNLVTLVDRYITVLVDLNSFSTVPVNQNYANPIGKALSKNGFEKSKKDGVYKWAVMVKPI
jgi:hypothetical protein